MLYFFACWPQAIIRRMAFLVLILTLVGAPLSARAAGGLAPRSLADAAGTIAYVRNESELHLVQPDGGNDHVIWTAPNVGGVQSAIRYPAWRPDAAEIAFVSDMEQTTSLLQSDIYAVSPDGSGLRKISDPPLSSQLSSFPKATVAVRVTNHDLSDSLFIIYEEGARQPQSVTVAAGQTKTVTFDNVAVFADQAQLPVAIDGVTRWFGLTDTQALQPGAANGASVDIYASGGYDDFGAFSPVWRSDGAEIDYPIGQACVADGLPAYPDAGSTWGDPIAQYSASMCSLDRGPTSALADQILYWDKLGNFPDGAFVQATEGGSQGAVVLDTGYFGFVYGLQWLPDGVGFLYSYSDGSNASSNVYEYDFASGQATQLTHFSDQYAGRLSISPDGQFIVFEKTTVEPLANPDVEPDLWMMHRDGSGAALFVQNGRDPSWSRQTPVMPNPTPTPSPTPPVTLTHKTFMPLLVDQ